jgi:hypothetical protein
LPALLLILAVIGALYVRLWYAPNPRAAVIGAFVLGAVGVHACVDYIFHFPAIPVTAAAIVASALGGSRSRLTVRVPSPHPTEQQ